MEIFSVSTAHWDLIVVASEPWWSRHSCSIQGMVHEQLITLPCPHVLRRDHVPPHLMGCSHGNVIDVVVVTVARRQSLRSN